MYYASLEAQVVLVDRDIDKWHESVIVVVGEIFG